MAEDTKQYFVDGVANLNLSLGAFRFDLVSLKAAQTGSDQPELENHVRVVMSPQGYLQMVTALENFLKQVEEKGIIRREAVADTGDISADESGLKKKKDKDY